MDEKSLHEVNQYNDVIFPVGLYEVTRDSIVPKGRGHLDLHWHEELQFTVVSSGTMVMQVDGKLYDLKQGDAIFINQRLLHVSRNLSEGGRYFSIDLPSRLLGFFSGSRMEKSYVFPYTSDYLFQTVVFQSGIEWQRGIVSHLKEIEKLLKEKRQGFEYRVAVILVTIWGEMLQYLKNDVRIPPKSYYRRQERMRAMLSFIHEHYAETIQLADIAAHVGISVGECCRCFKQFIRESPNQYILHYRIMKAMDLLSDTDCTVSEVSFKCGFSDVSHFILYFKRHTGLTPGAYRELK